MLPGGFLSYSALSHRVFDGFAHHIVVKRSNDFNGDEVFVEFIKSFRQRRITASVVGALKFIYLCPIGVSQAGLSTLVGAFWH